MIKRFIKNYFKNFDTHSKRKLIVFLSDDWGGVRVRSIEARQNLIKAGIAMDSNRFDKFDTLESNEDMEKLFDILLSFKDHNGNHPVITAVTNVANPEFDKIRENNFENYFYEPFIKTLKRYPNHNKVYKLYKKGIELKIFMPELHGREHLQVNWWMNYLKLNNPIVRQAFDNEFWHLGGKYLSNPLHRDLTAAFDIADISELDEQKKILSDSIRLFEKIFGYKPVLFVPPSQHYNDELENIMNAAEIKLLNVPRLRKMPLGNRKYQVKFHYTGQKNKYEQRYLVRNVVFEPNINLNDDGVDVCLSEIGNAFKHKTPAVISNHRAAFVGGIDVQNRNKGLKALNKLFSNILKLWPDAEFTTASDLRKIMIRN